MGFSSQSAEFFLYLSLLSCEAIEVDRAIDVTGCGNTSAAAALYWRIEGDNFDDIVYNANKAANICSKHEGSIELLK